MDMNMRVKTLLQISMIIVAIVQEFKKSITLVFTLLLLLKIVIQAKKMPAVHNLRRDQILCLMFVSFRTGRQCKT
jgi:hypothetical protein